MPEGDAPATEPAKTDAPATEAPKTLESLLGDLPEAQRDVVLGEVRKARDEAHGLRTRLKDAEPKLAEYDKWAEASKTELQRANEAAEANAQKANLAVAKLAAAEVRAAAADKFNDPTDATAFIDATKFVKDDGAVDSEAVQKAVSDLLVEKPHLAKRSGPAPDKSQGAGAAGAPAGPANQLQDIALRLLGGR